MRRHLVSLLCFLISVTTAFADECKREITVYSYGSLSSEKGFLKKAAESYEKFCSSQEHCRCEVKLKSVGSAAQLVSQIDIDSKRKTWGADLAVGLDELTFQSVKGKVVIDPQFAPDEMSERVPEVFVEKGFYPFDYGIFAFMADTNKLKELQIEFPKSLVDLMGAGFSKKLILEDPRTSTPGLAWVAFLQHTEKNWSQAVTKLQPQWLTLAPGWESAYSLFMKGEAPLVWSYTTSEAYHREKGDAEKHRYRAVTLEEGAPVQIEGAVILKDSEQSKKFINYLRSKVIQQEIPLTQYMLPIRTDVKLPKSFEGLAKPKKLFPLRMNAKEREELLKEWKGALR